MFNAINISASGLTAQRLRMDIISNNIANADTTRTSYGEYYQRQMPVFATKPTRRPLGAAPFHTRGGGVEVVGIMNDPSPPRLAYDPHHPEANEDGYVEYPNVNIVSEMVDMIAASRAYEANVTSLNTAKDMAMRSLEIGRG